MDRATSQNSASDIDISVVLPVFNEKDSLPLLNQKLIATFEEKGWRYEIIYIDDGSTDSSADVIERFSEENGSVKGVLLRRNFGQSAATAAGIDHARGRIIVIMDSDLQNDPSDIPLLIERIENGADIVSGWRRHRKDNPFFRNFPSWVANRLIRRISGLKIHDLGCSLKAYRGEIIKEVKLYGETHRFIAIYANMIGGRVEEVEVSHHARRFGVSKYGLSRVIKVLLDLIVLKYMLSYATKPIYFFGKLAMFIAFLGLCSMSGLFVHKFVYGTSFVRSPFLMLTSIIFLVAFQTILFGLVGELLMRIYHESQAKPVYHIRKFIDRQSPDAPR